ncbi:hypothetical protein QL898_05460 [Psychrobacter sp. APC 3279]|uniref:hypothetical protein n=1 Tax=Psychrobacter sp. APC 3279 TaxID=3035189 RepID=UPI0025B2ABD5|nr:hypothetical protein [Psychrobacter sp. APC 3279]MDN3441071.1 hypothetical protein [Psychrobacter sp. APC 3279]
MTATAKTGASQLHLDNTELRRELIHADIIIANARMAMEWREEDLCADMNAINAQAKPSDPFRSAARHQAMHRITPKCDYVKLFLFIATLLLSALHIFNYYG